MLRTLTVIALILPLSIDAFVLSSALGAAGVAKRERFRTSVVLSAFEGGMPIVGFLVGARIGGAVGQVADYLAAAVLAVIGAWMLWPRRSGGEEEEKRNVRLLASTRGWAVLALGLSISVDELAIGFGVGLLRLPLALLVVLIAVQAFIVAQLGMRLGSRVAERGLEVAERSAGALLVLAAALVLLENLLRTN